MSKRNRDSDEEFERKVKPKLTHDATPERESLSPAQRQLIAQFEQLHRENIELKANLQANLEQKNIASRREAELAADYDLLRHTYSAANEDLEQTSKQVETLKQEKKDMLEKANATISKLHLRNPGVWYWENPSADILTPGMFVRIFGENAEGKRELWWGQIDQVFPNKHISIASYWKPATDNGLFYMKQCDASDGFPVEDEQIGPAFYRLQNRLPSASQDEYNIVFKDACEAFGTFANCQLHTAEEHEEMDALREQPESPQYA